MDLIQSCIGVNNKTLCTGDVSYKIHRNADKKSKVHYICVDPAQTQSQNVKLKKVKDQHQDEDVLKFKLKGRKSTDDEAHILSQKYHNIGLLTKSVTFDRNCFVIELVKGCTLSWILHKFQQTFDSSIQEKVAPSPQKVGDVRNDVCYYVLPSSLYTKDCSSVDSLRQLILSQHLLKLLQRHLTGFSSPSLLFDSDVPIEELISRCIKGSESTVELDDSAFVSQLLNLSFVEPISDSEWLVRFSKPVTIHGCEVTEWRLVKDSFIYACLCRIHSILFHRPHIVIHHVITVSQSYQHQVMLTILNEMVCLLHKEGEITNNTVEMGVVKLSPPASGVQQYIESRRNYLVASSQEKFGAINVTNGGFWQQRITELTLASIKFELLSRSPQQTVSIATEDGGSCDVKIGSFVMYNCSRIATLLNNFNKSVDLGTYPELSAFQDTDLSLLKTQDEWILVFHYINVYPVLVSDLVSTTREGEISLVPGRLSQIVKFLHSLCRDFSTYYSRTHILGEPHAHLMPQMMARLWLVKIVYQILVDGLSLLDISPYDSM